MSEVPRVFARFRPLIESEEARGNRFHYALTEREYRELMMPSAFAEVPFDRGAIHAMFALGPDVHEVDVAGQPLWFYLDEPECAVYGGVRRPSWRQRRRRDAWWREWRAAPRPKVIL